MQKKKVIMNLVVSTLVQIITLVLGMILPRVILITWGSEYNGLLSSITNILGYLSLLEAGFNTATLQSLYKSVGEGDRLTTSVIIRTSQCFYRKMAVLYAAIVGGIALLYPLFIETTIAYWEVVLIIGLQGAVGVINFAFRASYQQLLKAEGKYYIISLITFMTTVLTYVVKILSVLLYNSIFLMQVLSIVVIVVQITVYATYFEKEYWWIDKNAICNNALLQNRKYYFLQQIAGLVFNSTDTFVLSVFCGLKVASVYAIYNMIFRSLSQIITMIRGSTNYILGQSYHKDVGIFGVVYDTYSALQSMMGGIIASISSVMIVSFVQIYTDGITDISYVDRFSAFLFSFSLVLECSRGTSLASANIAGKASDTTWRYVLEAGINLVSSLILVQYLGMRGVLIGTVLAGIYRTIDSIVYTNRYVLKRSPFVELKTAVINIVLYFCITYIGMNICVVNAMDYGEFFSRACVSGMVITFIYGLVFLVESPRSVNRIIRLLRE